MQDHTPPPCPECDALDRRGFIRTLALGGAALTAGSANWLLPGSARADTKPIPRVANPAAEDLVKELFAGLTDAQKKKPSSNPGTTRPASRSTPTRRSTRPLDAVYTKAQQDLVQKIVRAIASDDNGWHQISRNGTWDATKSFDKMGADIFGDPSTGKFAFLCTGHHLTVRCDGDSEEGAAFGGPIYYGHSPNGYSPKNVFSYQTRQMLKAYQALDEKQRKQATVTMGHPGEGARSIRLKKDGKMPGIAYAELTKDQQDLFEKVMQTILSPFRQQDGS